MGGEEIFRKRFRGPRAGSYKESRLWVWIWIALSALILVCGLSTCVTNWGIG